MHYEPNYFENRLRNLEEKFLAKIIFKYEEKVKLARDKELVIKEQLNELFAQFYLCFIQDAEVEMLIYDFWYDYRRGNSIDKQIIKKSTEIKQALENGVELPDSIFKYKNPYRLVNFFAKYAAFYQFIQIYKKEFPELCEELEIKMRGSIESPEAQNKIDYIPSQFFPYETTKIDDSNNEDDPLQLSSCDTFEDGVNHEIATNIRQTLTMVLLLDELEITNNDNTKKAKLISMLTGKSSESIRKLLSNLYGKTKPELLKDIEFIYPFIKELGIKNIENKILSKIKMLKNDIENQVIKNM